MIYRSVVISPLGGRRLERSAAIAAAGGYHSALLDQLLTSANIVQVNRTNELHVHSVGGGDVHGTAVGAASYAQRWCTVRIRRRPGNTCTYPPLFHAR